MDSRKKPPFFSVVITTYNRAHLLQRALDSLLNQTDQDFECIVIDDGSSDNTRFVLQKYFDQIPDYQYKWQENRGVVDAKNRGMAMASGKFITFLDSDDAYKPNHLALRKQILLENPAVDLLHGGVEIIGNPYVPDWLNPGKMMHIKDCAVSGTFFIKNTRKFQLNFQGEALGSDAILLQKAVQNNLTIKKTEKTTYIYHHNTPDSITNQFLKKTFK